jgi:hypothetical protein
MKKTSFLITPHLIILSSIIFSILFVPVFACAESRAYYRCVDKEGNEIISNNPVGDYTCKQIGRFEEITKEESDKYYKDREQKKTEAYEKSKIAEEKEAEEKARSEQEEAIKAQKKEEEERLREVEEVKRSRGIEETPKEQEATTNQ